MDTWIVCLFTGVNMVKRKLATHDNLKITLEQTGDKFVVKEASTFRTLDMEFTLGVTFEYALADGTMLSVSNAFIQYYIVLYYCSHTDNGCGRA